MGLVNVFCVAEEGTVLALDSLAGFVNVLSVEFYGVFVFEEFATDVARDVFLFLMNLTKMLLHSSKT